MKLPVNSQWRLPGFTLMESLVVLGIVSCFLLLPNLAVRSLAKNLEERQFFELFESRVLACQQYAITKGRKSRMMGEEGMIHFKAYKGLQGLTVPESITVYPFDVGFHFSSGSFGKLDELVFTTDAYKVTYRFQMGSGKYVKSITY